MGWIDWTLSILTIIVGIVLTIVVMLQSSKDQNSVITGGNNTFYGSNKSKTLDGILSKYTVGLAIIFCILCFATTFSILK